MAASKITAKDINFMARYGRGLICLTLTREHCRELNLPLMARNSYSGQVTNFTVSIEAASGVTTGISAADRAHTIRTAVAEDVQPTDVVQPGHVFPLMAQPGGVLSRAGHTEAGCDLAALAGLHASAVIVEILNEDGTMARMPDLQIFAKEHGLKIGTIADLIEYRNHKEGTVKRVSDCTIPTEFGDFHLHAFQDTVDNDVHIALVKGDIVEDEAVMVRVHVQNPINDIPANTHKNRGWPIRNVMQRIADEGKGVIVILCNQFDPQVLIEQVRSYHDDEISNMPIRKNLQGDLRTYGFGAQILKDLGVKKMRLMSAPKKIHALSGFDLEVEEYIY